jgi:hypothetical protein
MPECLCGFAADAVVLADSYGKLEAALAENHKNQGLIGRTLSQGMDGHWGPFEKCTNRICAMARQT